MRTLPGRLVFGRGAWYDYIQLAAGGPFFIGDDSLRGQDGKTYLFEEAPLARAVASLAVPTVISSLVTVVYNLADTYFVSMLNDPIENAAVTLAAPVMLAFNAVNNLFGVGSSSLMSRSLGCKDYDAVAKSSAFGFYCSLFAGLLFSLLCFVFRSPLLGLLGTDAGTREATNGYMLWTVYLGAAPTILNVVMAYLVRAEGSSMHASIGTTTGCLLNIVLDPIFIMPWGLGMGAAGAGLATFISNCVACGYFFVLLAVKRGKTYVCVDIRRLSFERGIVLSICGVGVPAAIQNLLNVTGMTILNNLTQPFGADAIAAMGIAQKLAMVTMYAALGFSQGVMPLVSYNYSSGNIKRMKGGVRVSLGISLGFIVAICALFCCFPGFFVRLFMDNGSVVSYGGRFLVGLALAQPFMCVDFMAVGIFQAVGLGRNSLIFAILRKIVLEIPALLILNRLFPLYGLAYAQLVAEFVLAAAAVAAMLRIFRRLEAGLGLR